MQALLDYGGEDSEENDSSDESSYMLLHSRTDVNLSTDSETHHNSSCNNNISVRELSNEGVHMERQAADIKNLNKQSNKREPLSDFFGLDSSDSDNAGDDEPSCKHRKKESNNNKVKVGGVEINLPDSEFWADAATDIGTLAEASNPPNYNNSKVDKNRSDYGVSCNYYPYKGIKYANYKLGRGHFHSKPKSKSPFPSQVQYSQNFVRSYEPVNLTGNEEHRSLYHIHSKISPYLRSTSDMRHQCRPCKKKQISLSGHKGVVNRVKWCCQNYSHLLLSASMDNTIKVWNCWSQVEHCVRTFTHHRKAVKDAEWSADGKKILSCSYDRTAVLTNVESGQVESKFTVPGYGTCGKFHPMDSNLIVVGSSNCLLCWDLRQPSDPVKEFTHKNKFGQVQDLIISPDGTQVFGSSDLVSRESSDRNIIAWDFDSSVVLSNQIFQERYVCSRLKLHPTEETFLAQTHGNYIAVFSINRPYKLNKYRRFDEHKMHGYNIGFDVSSDGSLVCSGSGDGQLHFYHYQSGKTIRTLPTGWDICMDVSFHPVMFSTTACASWSGDVAVWA